MKQFKTYMLLVCMSLLVVGCAYDGLKDDVSGLEGRVTLIEEQVKLLNDNLKVMSYILDSQNKTIQSVTKGKAGGEHVITLSDGTQLCLTVGKPGTVEEPDITVGDDKCWYINGESTGVSAVGTNGKDGDGYPEFRVEDGKWQVRFGAGEWKDVPGGSLSEGTTLGDQLFESAAKEGDSFVVTLKNGKTYTLPIVSGLECVIDGTSLNEEGYLLFENDTRQTVDVKIGGENPQVIYPQGWRAVLVAKDAADTNGNTHTLYIYAPAAASTGTRAVANNQEDIAVSAQKDMFWAMDKIKVKIKKAEPEPEPEKTNLDIYNTEGLTVGRLTVSRDVYGDAKVITGDAEIAADNKVYFVSTGNATLTCTLEEKDDLIILPISDDVKTINLQVKQRMQLTGTLICQNVNLSVNDASMESPFCAKAENINFVLDKCVVEGAAGKQLLGRYSTGTATSAAKISITDSDIKFNAAGVGYNVVKTMDCKEFVFSNNKVYFTASAGNVTGLKIFEGGDYEISTLTLSSNTLIDVESSGASASGLVMASKIGTLNVNKNIWRVANTAVKACFLICAKSSSATPTITTYGDIKDNYVYVDNGKKAALFQKNPANMGATPDVVKLDADVMFDTADASKFDKANGIFIPNSDYEAYGAKR